MQGPDILWEPRIDNYNKYTKEYKPDATLYVSHWQVSSNVGHYVMNSGKGRVLGGKNGTSNASGGPTCEKKGHGKWQY